MKITRMCSGGQPAAAIHSATAWPQQQQGADRFVDPHQAGIGKLVAQAHGGVICAVPGLRGGRTSLTISARPRSRKTERRAHSARGSRSGAGLAGDAAASAMIPAHRARPDASQASAERAIAGRRTAPRRAGGRRCRGRGSTPRAGCGGAASERANTTGRPSASSSTSRSQVTRRDAGRAAARPRPRTRGEALAHHAHLERIQRGERGCQGARGREQDARRISQPRNAEVRGSGQSYRVASGFGFGAGRGRAWAAGHAGSGRSSVVGKQRVGANRDAVPSVPHRVSDKDDASRDLAVSMRRKVTGRRQHSPSMRAAAGRPPNSSAASARWRQRVVASRCSASSRAGRHQPGVEFEIGVAQQGHAALAGADELARAADAQVPRAIDETVGVLVDRLQALAPGLRQGWA